jgi:hypothetical protein
MLGEVCWTAVPCLPSARTGRWLPRSTDGNLRCYHAPDPRWQESARLGAPATHHSR